MEDRLRIALFYNLRSGGGKRALYEWVRHLSLRHEIDVFTLSTADHSYCDIRPYVQQYKILEFTPNPLFKSPFGRLNQLQRWRDLGRLNDIGRQIAEDINQGNYDVVFSHGCVFTMMPTFIKYSKINSVHYLHEPFGKNFKRSIKRPYLSDTGLSTTLNRVDPLIRLYAHRLQKIQHENIVATTLLLANSKFTQEFIQSSFGCDSEVSYCGVSSDEFRPSEEKVEMNYVISVGELSSRKGFDFIIRSLAHIPPKIRPPLVLVCNQEDSKEKAFLLDLADQLKVEVQIIMHQNRDQLCSLYNQASICVYTPVMEPFGLVPLEAMACAIAVVGVAEGGVIESVVDGQTGILVRRDEPEFARAVQNLLENKELRLKLGKNGREYIQQNWGWDKSTEGIEKYLIRTGSL